MKYRNKNYNRMNQMNQMNQMYQMYQDQDDFELYLNLLMANFSLNLCCIFLLWTLIFSACKNVSLSCMIVMFFGIVICLSIKTIPSYPYPNSYPNSNSNSYPNSNPNSNSNSYPNSNPN
jgi:hypothetical protein